MKLRLSDDVYWAVLARAGSARRLSQTVEELLRMALAAEGLESFKNPVLKSSEHPSPPRTQAPSPLSTESLSPPRTQEPSPPRIESLSPSSTQFFKDLSTESLSPPRTETPRPAAERRELKVEAPPPKIELPGKPEPPPIPAVAAAAEAPRDRVVEGQEAREVEAPREGAAEGRTGGTAPEEPSPAPRGAGPTPKQLQLIEGLLKQFGDGWETVREVLLLDKGIEAPEDYRQLSGEALDKVIKALKEWARRPAMKELRDARLKAQRLFEQGIDVGLPESTRDVLRYHLVKLELAEAGALKPRK